MSEVVGHLRYINFRHGHTRGEARLKSWFLLILFDFVWSCPSFARLSASKLNAARSAWSPDRTVSCQFVAPTLQFWWRPVFVPLFTCILVCFGRLYSCRRWCSNILCILGVFLVLLFLRSLFLQWHRMLHCASLWDRRRALRRELSQRSSWTKSG